VGLYSSRHTQLTGANKAFIEAMPGYVMAQLKSLSVNPQAAVGYTENIADYLAAEMSAHFIKTIFLSVQAASAQDVTDLSKDQWMKDLKRQMEGMDIALVQQGQRMQGTERLMQMAEFMRSNLNRAGVIPDRLSTR
jgi:hypothetical protein